MTYWKHTITLAAIALVTGALSVASAQGARDLSGQLQAPKGCPVDTSGQPVVRATSGELMRTVPEGTRSGSFVCRDGRWRRAASGHGAPPIGGHESDKTDFGPEEFMGGGAWKIKPGKGVGPSDAHQPGGESPGSGFD